MMFFDVIPRWQDISTCQKILLATVDIMYSCITLGIPVGAGIITQSPVAFFGVACIEAVCCTPPTIPGCIIALSIFKHRPGQVWSDELKENLITERDAQFTV